MRSTPPIHVAISAISAVTVVTSSRAGNVIEGGPIAAARATARWAPSRISRQARPGCRFSAANRDTERFTTTASISGTNGRASSAVASSPVISTTGTP